MYPIKKIIRLKIRFPVYESFFDQIFNGYITAGKLFVSRIKDDNILEYHLNRKDLKSRTCLQIMSQNRLYSILDDNNIGAIIGKYWGGNTVQYGLYDCSSFTYIMRYNITSDLILRKNFTKEYNNLKHFVFNYYCFRDTVSTRYYFKEFYNVILVIIYQLLIYFCVLDNSLENTINHNYPVMQAIIFYGSLALVINKISSLIFFSLVNRWYIEIDNHIGEIIFTITLFIHFLNLKQWFIPIEDLETNELINAILLSYQIGYQWYRVIDGLKATKMYGGFLRTVFVLIKKMFLLVCFFYCFILLCTGVFNLLFHQYRQFKTYFNSFFYLAQAALQQYDLDIQWTKFLNFSLMIVMIISTLILMNLIIALATKIYDDVDEHIEPEHRGNLVKIYEYLRYDENYGIFKFVSSPFNFLAIPFMFLILFVDDKKYWDDIFTRIIYFPVALSFYVLFIFINTIRLLYVYIHQLIMVPIRYEFNVKTYLIIIFLGPFLYFYYYALDLVYFWYYAYQTQNQSDKETSKAKDKILEFRELFSLLFYDISETVEKEKKNKKFSIGELVSGWLENLNSQIPKKGSEENNRMHKKSLIQKKYRNSTVCLNPNDVNYRTSHATLFRNYNNKISITEHLHKIFGFLVRFADREGFIEKELAKNIFPKRYYYDDEYFEYLYYFRYKYFKSIISRFIKNNNEERKEMNKLRGVLTDIQKIHEKFNVLKFNLKNIPNKNLSILSSGISTINTTFAILENNLLDAQTKEIYKRMWINPNNKETSSLQKQNQADGMMNKMQDQKNNLKKDD